MEYNVYLYSELLSYVNWSRRKWERNDCKLLRKVLLTKTYVNQFPQLLLAFFNSLASLNKHIILHTISLQ